MAKRDFLETNGFSAQEILDLMNLGVALKACVRAQYYPPLLAKRCIVVLPGAADPIDDVAFGTAACQLGGHVQFWSLPLSAPEEARDAAALLTANCDLVVLHLTDHEMLCSFARQAEIPVVNAASGHSVPLQEIALLITMFEHLPPEKKLDACKVVFEGPCSPLCMSVLYAASKIGMQFVQRCPAKSGQLQPPVLKFAERNVKKSGGAYAVTDSEEEAYRGADFLFADAPMGEKLPPSARGIMRVDTRENRLAAARAILTFLLYENPAAREPILVEKMKRMLAVKLHAVFGYGEATE